MLLLVILSALAPMAMADDSGPVFVAADPNDMSLVSPLAAEAIRYREEWVRRHAGVYAGRPIVVDGGRTPPSAPASAASTTTTTTAAEVRMDPTAKCPKGKPTTGWTQAQYDACVAQAITNLNTRVTALEEE